MNTDKIEEAEIIDEETTSTTEDSRQVPPAGTQSQQPHTTTVDAEQTLKANRTLWNGAIFTFVLILLCAVLVFFFPKGNVELQSANIGLGSLLVYFLVMTFTTLGSVNTYQKGLTQFAARFEKDGSRALDLIRWGFMLAIMGVVFHCFIFYLPIVDVETKRQFSTLFLGNSIVLLAAIVSIVGFLMLATSKGIPDTSRKGCLLMLVSQGVLLLGMFIAPYATSGSKSLRILELVILLAGAVVFLVAWRRILKQPADE